MMRVVRLVLAVQRRERNLTDVHRACLVLGHHPDLGAEIREDGGGLVQDQGFAVGGTGAGDAQGRDREDRGVAVGVADVARVAVGQGGGVAVLALVGEVCVGHPGGFEGKADVLAAAGSAGVVEEFVLWVGALFFGGLLGHFRGEVVVAVGEGMSFLDMGAGLTLMSVETWVLEYSLGRLIKELCARIFSFFSELESFYFGKDSVAITVLSRSRVESFSWIVGRKMEAWNKQKMDSYQQTSSG